MAFTWLELRKVNVTAMRGSVNVFVLVCVCVCVASGCKAAPNVHLPSSQPTWAHSHMHMCAPHTYTNTLHCTRTYIHTGTCRNNHRFQTFSAYLYRRCFPCFSSAWAYLHSYRHLHKNIPPFLKLSPWCSCNTECDINITSFPTRIQKCTYTYFTTGVKRSTRGNKRLQQMSTQTYTQPFQHCCLHVRLHVHTICVCRWLFFQLVFQRGHVCLAQVPSW